MYVRMDLYIYIYTLDIPDVKLTRENLKRGYRKQSVLLYYYTQRVETWTFFSLLPKMEYQEARL